MLKPRDLFSDVLIATGAAIVLFSVTLVILIMITAVPLGTPYTGVFVFIFLPTLVIVGIIIFVFGVLTARKKEPQAPGKGRLVNWFKLYSWADFKDPRTKKRLGFFLAVGVVEVLALSIGGMKMAEFMDTSEFCGKTCHQVMKPEYATYQQSSHARVPCTECHIGPGASWLVRSKVSGVKQLFAVTFNTYPRPIESPVQNLRPARETCEICHWPEKFAGGRVLVKPHYASDEQNTPGHQVLEMKVGGGGADIASGIHWHTVAKVNYLSLDDKRQQIAWVGVQRQDGGTTEYYDPDQRSEVTPDLIAKEKRLMDCIDCHNRAGHNFQPADDLLNQAIYQGKIDSSVPFIKKVGLDYLTQPEGQATSATEVADFYRTNYPDVYAQKTSQIERATVELQKLAGQVSFSEMKVDPATHTNNLRHTTSTGCFRCHGKLKSMEGTTISNDCTTCHNFLPATVISS